MHLSSICCASNADGGGGGGGWLLGTETRFPVFQKHEFGDPWSDSISYCLLTFRGKKVNNGSAINLQQSVGSKLY